MKSLSCRELGAKDSYVATGRTEKEVIEKMIKHIQVHHRDMLQHINPLKEREMIVLMREKIHNH